MCYGPPPNVYHFNAAISACESSGYWEGGLESQVNVHVESADDHDAIVILVIFGSVS